MTNRVPFKGVLKLVVAFILVMASLTLCGCDKGKIKDFTPNQPYKQFFKEVRGTDSPIEDIWITDGILYVVTEDGQKDIVCLEVE